MASRLAPCPSCTRHVKVGASTCPFCGGELAREVALRAGPKQEATHARRYLLRRSAATTTACDDQGQATAFYGVFIDAGFYDATADAGEPATHYGVFIDAHAIVPTEDGGASKDAASDSGEAPSTADGG